MSDYVDSNLRQDPFDRSSTAGSSPVVVPPAQLASETDLTDPVDDYDGPEGFATIVGGRGPSMCTIVGRRGQSLVTFDENKTSQDLGETILRHHIDVDADKTLSRTNRQRPTPAPLVGPPSFTEDTQQQSPKSFATADDVIPTPILPTTKTFTNRSQDQQHHTMPPSSVGPVPTLGALNRGIKVTDNDFVHVSINESTKTLPATPPDGSDPQELNDQDVIKAVLREAATLSTSSAIPAPCPSDVARQRQPTDDEYPGNVRFPPLGSIRVVRPNYPDIPTPSAVSSETSGGTEKSRESQASLETLQGENKNGKDDKDPAGANNTQAATLPNGGNGPDIPDPVPFSASSRYWASYFFDLIIRIADVVLSIVYIATYNPACFALVSGFTPGLAAAHRGIQTVSVALGIGISLLLWDVWLAWCIRARGFTWAQAFAHTYGRRVRDMHAVSFNGVKGRALIGVIFRDTTTLAILTANLGPRDRTVPVVLKLSISAWLAAKDSATLATVFYAGCCFYRRVSADRTYYKQWPFRAVRAVILIVTLLWSLFVPFGLLIFKPDVLVRNVYLTLVSPLPTVELSVVCIPDFNSRSIPSSIACNPTLCPAPAQPSSAPTISNWFGWSPVHNSTIRFANVRVCASRSVAASPAPVPSNSLYAGLAWTFPLPNGRNATYFADTPCLAPVIDMPGLIPQALAVTDLTQAQLLAAGLLGGPQRAPAAAWAQSLSRQSALATLARNGGRSTFRAQQTGPEANLDSYAPAYRSHNVPWGVTANHYLASDRVPRYAHLVCPREWVFPVVDPVVQERYLITVRIVHDEQVVGPLSCSFNGAGLPPVRGRGHLKQQQQPVWVRAGGGQ